MKMNKRLLLILFMFYLMIPLKSVFSQIQATDKRYIRIGSLQTHFSAYGSERAWNNSYYEGLRWPAEYARQDNAVIKRFWLGVKNFKDADNHIWGHYAIYVSSGFVGASLFPVELKETAKYPAPYVFVDGYNLTAPYLDDVDEINPNQIADRIVTNVVNTSMGLTITRRIYAFSQQYHDNYMIKEFTYTNTGNTDYDDDIELTAPLDSLRISWGTRYSVCWDGAFVIGGAQTYGKYSWVTKRGEDYAAHAGESITLANPIVQWLRCGFEWAGQGTGNTFDNIGAPDYTRNGRLRAPQHAGVAILHVDKSPTDSTDDPAQPIVIGWHAGDERPSFSDMSYSQEQNMALLYNTILSGIPYKGLGGNERFDEKYMPTHKIAYTVHNDGGGTNLWVVYGPFNLKHGESIKIIEAEGVNGLSRPMCEKIGKRWELAYKNPNDKGPFTLPDGKSTTDKDEYKDDWVYTGKDSIMLTFSRAQRNYDLHYQIPQPPQPPKKFIVISGGDRISLKWDASESEKEADFGGYKVFRAVGKPDTVFDEIFACGLGTGHPEIVHSYDDVKAVRGFSYYYYVVAFNDGSDNNTQANPHGPLMSSKYYTRTTQPAYLRRAAGRRLSDVRIVPNPFYIKATDIQFPKEYDKIMFYNIPGQCDIKIYTERGDLIKTIHHTDGSGDEAWNSVTDYRQVVVSGLYIAHIEVTKNVYDTKTQEIIFKKGESINKKLIIIR